MEGPRPLKDPGSPEWCWQTVSALQHMWKSLHLDYEHYTNVLAEAEEHAIWERIPPERPYGSKKNMLKQVEVGDTKDAHKRMRLQALAAQVRAMQNNGGDRRSAEVQFDERQTEKPTQGGNGQAYLLALLKRDAPEILARLLDGEFGSARAAARAAGIPVSDAVKTVRLTDNVEKVADKLKGHYSDEQVRRIADRLLVQEDGTGADPATG